MAHTNEIRTRISSVNNTKKITNAMYLISSTKLQHARRALNSTRPYFDRMENEIRRIFQSESDVKSRYFYPETGRKPAETYAYLVITADKGLAGSYNYNVLRQVEEERKKHKKIKFYVVGEFGRHYFMKHNIPMEKAFLYTAQNPTMRRAREICSILLTEYDENRVDEIRIIYSDMENELVSNVKLAKVLPFERKSFFTPEEERSQVDIHFQFYPSVTEVLDRCMPGYIAGFIYGALVDSFSAEQNARMTAMSSANNNAEALLGRLQLQYNTVRQTAITQEITEISAGAKAQRLHHEGRK
ncbi:MAG: ATP synthase F1 subunit gamma [Eubacterium sp.]|nr:ATP synthase F1 subunit gamma [Eubacterium sp.]